MWEVLQRHPCFAFLLHFRAFCFALVQVLCFCVPSPPRPGVSLEASNRRNLPPTNPPPTLSYFTSHHSKSNRMLVFEERGKPDYPTNSAHLWHRVRELKLWHRWELSSLCKSCSLNYVLPPTPPPTQLCTAPHPTPHPIMYCPRPDYVLQGALKPMLK